MEKKTRQLGMNPGTASHRLKVDLLFMFAIKAGIKCFRCKRKLTRDTFSIEHKIAWLDSNNPIELFFNLENVGFSHKRCNYQAKRSPNKKYFSKEDKQEAQRRFQRESNARHYTTEKRSARYLRTGN